MARRRFVAAVLLGSLLPMAVVASSANQAFGQTVGRAAPQWDILEWIGGNGGNVDQHRGKVIVIDFFQLWCPGCNKFSGPLMSHWQKKYAASIASGDMALVKIHTVFEGHNYQTVRKLRSYIQEKGITIPVGVDRHRDGDRIPITMRRYQTRGTPEMVIIDRTGVIRFQHIGYFDHEKVEILLAKLLGKKRA